MSDWSWSRAFAVAAVSSWLVVVPLTFVTALVLGAIVAPPDAVTAVAVGRKLGLPKRVMAILTGESLINDAAALTLFTIAVAQVAGRHTFIENPFLLFGYSAIVGPIVGALLGYVTLWIRRRLANPGLETVQGLVVPFAAFIAAEELHASGVLAVVVAGFVVGNGTLGAGYQTRLQERYVWNSVDVLLEAFVFAYIGLHLRFVLEDLRQAHESLIEVAVASVDRPADRVGDPAAVGVRDVRPQQVVPPRREQAQRAGPGRRPRRAGNATGATKAARQVAVADRPPGAVVAGERRGVVDRDARGGDAGRGRRHSGDHGQRRAVPRARDHPGDRVRGQRRHAADSGLDAAAADRTPAPVPVLRRPRRRPRRGAQGRARGARRGRRGARGVPGQPAGGTWIRACSPRSATTIARHSQDADEMPDPEAHTKRAEVFSALYRDVLAAQRAALIAERDAGRIEDEAVRAMLERLDLQEAGVSARLESRF